MIGPQSQILPAAEMHNTEIQMVDMQLNPAESSIFPMR